MRGREELNAWEKRVQYSSGPYVCVCVFVYGENGEAAEAIHQCIHLKMVFSEM